MDYKNIVVISSDWLAKKANDEMANIKSKSISKFRFMFTSSEKIKENEIEAAKSLARIELISEIFQNYTDNIKKIQDND